MGQKERFYADIMATHPGVTGSCHLVVVKLPNFETIRFVVDCGLFQEEGTERLNEELPFDPKKLHFCLVTHNHVDHIGRLPLLVKKGFCNKIYATAATCKLMPMALTDSLKVLTNTAKRNNKKALYNENNVRDTFDLFDPCEYQETIYVHDNVKVTFFKNGHLVGAALILVQVTFPGFDDLNLLFTGDYNNKNMFFDVPPLPNWVLELPLTVIQEATYGDKDSNIMVKSFERNILKTIRKNGTALVPVFSLGRTQEILYLLKMMQKSGKLNPEIPIFLDGKLAIQYTRLYIKNGLGNKEEMKDFLPENFTMVVSKEKRVQVLYGTKPKIVLTTSGMGSYGPAQVYIPEYISRRNVLIQFTGYTADGTLGAKLKNAKTGKTVTVGGIVVQKLAKVEYTTEFSAHAKADEMIAFLKQFKNLNLVLVNHGDPDVKEQFAQRILQEINPKRVGVEGREILFRINPYKLVKTMSTKFN